MKMNDLDLRMGCSFEKGGFICLFISEIYALHLQTLVNPLGKFSNYYVFLFPRGSKSKYLKGFEVCWGDRQSCKASDF